MLDYILHQSTCIAAISTVTAAPGTALAVALFAFALVVLIAWPGWGLLPRWRRNRGLRTKVRAEDALKHIFHSQNHDRSPTLESLAGAMGTTLSDAAETISILQKGEFLVVDAGGIRLTPEGERYALSVIRAHRLWELHLAEQTGVSASEWHRRADRQEHFITAEQADSLSAGLGHPTHDPHGDPIPNSKGEIPPGPSQPLPSLEPGAWARVVHIEDEPEQVCAQIRAMGLYPGTVIRVVENGAQRVRLWCDGEEHVLAPIVAASVSVNLVKESDSIPEPAGTTLAQVRVGELARVVRLSNRCRGAERRRLMDLGILPGTVLSNEMSSPAGELHAYRVKGALVALRSEQADVIQVSTLGETAQRHVAEALPSNHGNSIGSL